jgi:hypothetical protein
MEHDETRYGSFADEDLPLVLMLQGAIQKGEYLTLPHVYPD